MLNGKVIIISAPSSLYLVYDFNRLEKLAAKGDESWSAAVRLAINIYLDIINLFMDLLQLLGESN